MLITDRRTRTEEYDEVVDTVCNKCGKSCDGQGLLEAEVFGGYGAKLGDSNRYRFSFCEDCLEKMFEEFKFPPAVMNNVFGPSLYVQPKDMEDARRILAEGDGSTRELHEAFAKVREEQDEALAKRNDK